MPIKVYRTYLTWFIDPVQRLEGDEDDETLVAIALATADRGGPARTRADLGLLITSLLGGSAS